MLESISDILYLYLIRTRVYIVNKTPLLKGKLAVNQSVNHFLLEIYQKNKWRHTLSASVWIEKYA